MHLSWKAFHIVPALPSYDMLYVYDEERGGSATDCALCILCCPQQMVPEMVFRPGTSNICIAAGSVVLLFFIMGNLSEQLR